MKYLEFTFTLTPPSGDFLDVLASSLAEIGFDSFVKDEDENVSPADARGQTGDLVFTSRTDLPEQTETGGGSMKAYIKADDYNADTLRSTLDAFTEDFSWLTVKHEQTAVEDKDWNAEWEKNYFTPITVDDLCAISATFHQDVPRLRYNITINPRMSFGTGHHETTHQMLHALLTADLEGRDVLDMGCGTSILSILASQRGARRVMAVDVDPWCVENSRENLLLNGVDNVDVQLGDATLLTADALVESFDYVLANIHLNIITRDLPAYVRTMRKGAHFLTSGFYVTDLPRIREAAEACGLTYVTHSERGDWCCAEFVR